MINDATTQRFLKVSASRNTANSLCMLLHTERFLLQCYLVLILSFPVGLAFYSDFLKVSGTGVATKSGACWSTQ